MPCTERSSRLRRPIGAAVFALAPRIVPESRSEFTAKGGYDFGGAASITLGTIALVYTLIKADGWGWTSGRTLAGFAIAALLLVAFLLIERRHPDPLVPLRIFRNRSLSAADGSLLVIAAALFGVFFFCTLYLQQVLHHSPLRSGLEAVPGGFGVMAGSFVATRLVGNVIGPGLTELILEELGAELHEVLASDDLPRRLGPQRRARLAKQAVAFIRGGLGKRAA